MIPYANARRAGTFKAFLHTKRFKNLEKHLKDGILLLLTFILLQNFAFAQKDFRTGYVITQADDTLKGLVSYREGANAHRSCTFKTNDNQTITYGPTDITAYGFYEDRFFESHNIKVDGQSKPVFLEVLVKGSASLYKLESTFWVKKNDQELYPLVEVTTREYVDGSPVLRTSKRYVGILTLLLSDCEKLNSDIQKASLNERSLTKLTETYNQCKGGSSEVFKEGKPWTKVILSLSGGLNVSEIDFRYWPGFEHLDGPFEVSKAPVIGASIDLFSPRISEAFSLHADILFTKAEYIRHSVIDDDPYTRTNQVSIKLHELKIPLGIRYTFPGKKIAPYLNAGGSMTVHLSSKSGWIEEVRIGNLVQTYDEEAVRLKSKQFGLWGGVGAVVTISKRFGVFLETRFEQTNGISVDAPYGTGSSVSNMQFLVGIRTR